MPTGVLGHLWHERILKTKGGMSSKQTAQVTAPMANKKKKCDTDVGTP